MFKRLKYLKLIDQLEAELRVYKEIPLKQIVDCLERIERKL